MQMKLRSCDGLTLVFGLFLAYLMVLSSRSPTMRDLESGYVDLLYQVRGVSAPTNGSVVIVAIDKNSLKRFGNWPLSDSVFERIVKELLARDPAQLGINVAFLHPCKSAPPNKCLLSGTDRTIITAMSCQIPMQGIADPSEPEDTALSLAITDLARNGLGLISGVAPTCHGLPQFSDAMAANASALPQSTDPSQMRMPIYYGPRGTIRTYSAIDVVDGKIDSAAIHKKIVILGTDLGVDEGPTPYGLMTYTEVQATLTQNRVDGRSLKESFWLSVGIVTAEFMALLWVLRRGVPWALPLVIGGYIAISYILFWTALLLPIWPCIAALLASLLYSQILRLTRADKK